MASLQSFLLPHHESTGAQGSSGSRSVLIISRRLTPLPPPPVVGLINAVHMGPTNALHMGPINAVHIGPSNSVYARPSKVVHFEYDHRPHFRAGRRISTQPDSRLDKDVLQTCADVELFSFDNVSDVDFDDDVYSSDGSNVVTDDDSAEGLSWDDFGPMQYRSTSSQPCNKFNSSSEEYSWDDEFEPVQDHNAPSQPSSKPFNRLDFARVYDVTALRVSLAECRSLAYRLKGHLLNWPRVNNMARVDGDDLDWDIKNLLRDGKERREVGIKDSVLQAVYGTMAPPSRLAKRRKAVEKLGSSHFQFLERISRPGNKALRRMQKEREGSTIKYNRNRYYMVEVGDCQDQKQSLETSLQSMGFSMKKWIGPSRLLLLDVKYAGKSASELPMAVQVLLNERVTHNKGRPKREILPCKLTLFYEYWSMEEILKELLLQGELMPPAIKTMGHIAHLNLGEHYAPFKHLVGKVILDKQRPKVKTVVNNPEPVEGQCHPVLEVLAGNHSLVTTIIENGIPFHVNLATVYWNSELATERKRLIQKFSEKDIVCDVLAGAGPLAVASAKKVWRVFANDVSRDALKYLAKNVVENRLQAKVELYNLDGGEFLRKLLAFKNPVLMTQVVLSSPTSGETILDAFIGAFNRHTWPATQPLPMVHVYGYSEAPKPETGFLHRIVCRIRHPPEHVEMHRVKQVKSGMWLICATFQLPKAVAFND